MLPCLAPLVTYPLCLGSSLNLKVSHSLFCAAESCLSRQPLCQMGSLQRPQVISCPAVLLQSPGRGASGQGCPLLISVCHSLWDTAFPWPFSQTFAFITPSRLSPVLPALPVAFPVGSLPPPPGAPSQENGQEVWKQRIQARHLARGARGRQSREAQGTHTGRERASGPGIRTPLCGHRAAPTRPAGARRGLPASPVSSPTCWPYHPQTRHDRSCYCILSTCV